MAQVVLDAIESGDYQRYLRARAGAAHQPPATACWAAVRGNSWPIFRDLLEWGMQTRLWRSVHRLATPLQVCASMRNINPSILAALMKDYYDVRSYTGETARDLAYRLRHPCFKKVLRQIHPNGLPGSCETVAEKTPCCSAARAPRSAPAGRAGTFQLNDRG